MADLGKLGRYQLRRVLGKGAMGVVYEGFDPTLGRRVAVKTILRSLALDPETAKTYSARFVREAQAVARLNHPHIVQVHDFGEHDEVAFLVMEFVEGRELRSLFASGEAISLAESVRIMGELLDALAFAHQAGVIHRDIKPANVMLDAHASVKLTDFGVARIQESDQSAMGTMVGTPAFMSPEQISGAKVDRRTDIFSAGVILYQLLTGEQPFKGEGAWTVAKKIMQDDPPNPSRVLGSVPPAFDSITKKALAKDPAKRFATAKELSDALRRALAKVSVDSNETIPIDRIALAPKAKRRAWATLVTSLMVILGAIGVYFLFSQTSVVPTHLASQPSVTAQPELSTKPDIKPFDKEQFRREIEDSIRREFAEKAASEKAAMDKAIAEKAAVERAAAEQLAAARTAAEKDAADKAAKKAAADRLIAEKTAADRAAEIKIAADRAVTARLAAEKASAEKRANDQAALVKATEEKIRAERLAAEKVSTEKKAAAKLATAPAVERKATADKVAGGKNAVPTLALRDLYGRIFQSRATGGNATWSLKITFAENQPPKVSLKYDDCWLCYRNRSMELVAINPGIDNNLNFSATFSGVDITGNGRLEGVFPNLTFSTGARVGGAKFVMK